MRTLIFEDPVMAAALPGQFAMVWVPGVGELPMSVMIAQGDGRAAFTVRRHGMASTGLFMTGVGERIGVRGPYGNSFDARHGRLLMVGGGTGLVPIMRLLTATGPADDITVLIGARTSEEVFFDDVAERLLAGRPHQVSIATDDGSRGRCGQVTDLADDLMSHADYDGVYVCGPEIMMYKIVRSAHTKGLFVQASVERVMKCGTGICGSCCMDEDLVCRDGTVFDGPHLMASLEFGHFYRNKAGILQGY